MLTTETGRVRTFEELSDDEKPAAVQKAYDAILQAVVEGALRFNDTANGDDLQARIDTAMARAEELQTPWFAGEYVHDAAEYDLRGMAQCDAEYAVYADAHVAVFKL